MKATELKTVYFVYIVSQSLCHCFSASAHVCVFLAMPGVLAIYAVKRLEIEGTK